MRFTGRPTLSILGLVATLVALSAATAAAAPMPEPRLRSSTTLSTTTPAAGDLERALLRVEHRSGQSRVAENEIMADMMARMVRMGQTIGELHQLVAAMPAEPCPPAKATVCPPAANAASSAESEWPWLLAMAAITGAALLLGLTLRRRRNDSSETTEPVMAAAETPAVAPESPPTVMAHPLTRPRRRPRNPPTVAENPPALPPVKEEAWPASMQPAVDDSITDADLSLELADIMVSMGLADGAAQTLEGHIRQHPRQALIHWLKLLDVYRRLGQRDDFDKAVRELQENFNIAPPPWQPATRANVRPPGLEDYPHVIARILEHWPRKSCAQYMNRLLDDNRGGTRSGFPPVVIDEIMLLLNILRE